MKMDNDIINWCIYWIVIIYISLYYIAEMRRVKLIICQEEIERILLNEEDNRIMNEDNERIKMEDDERRLTETTDAQMEYQTKMRLRMIEIHKQLLIQDQKRLQEELEIQIKHKNEERENIIKQDNEFKESQIEHKRMIKEINKREDDINEEHNKQFNEEKRIRELQEEENRQKGEEEYENVANKIVLNVMGIIIVIVYFIMSLDNRVH
jgi:hypothetical protein